MSDNIEEKLIKLERAVKKQRILNVCLIGILSSFVLLGFQQKVKLPEFELPSVIEAEKFVLKSSKGTAAEFKMVDEKNAAIIFYKDNGSKVALNLGIANNNSYINIPGDNSNKFLINEDNSGIILYLSNDSKPNPNFIQLVTNNDSPYLQFQNSKNHLTYINNNGLKVIKDSLYMIYGKDFAFETSGGNSKVVDIPSSYGVNIYKADGNNREFYYSSGYDPINKNSYVEVYNPQSNSTASMKVINNYPGILGIKDGILRYLMFINEADKAVIKINDSQGKIRGVIGSESLNINGQQQQTDESTILLFDSKGSLLERLPK